MSVLVNASLVRNNREIHRERNEWCRINNRQLSIEDAFKLVKAGAAGRPDENKHLQAINRAEKIFRSTREQCRPFEVYPNSAPKRRKTSQSNSKFTWINRKMS